MLKIQTQNPPQRGGPSRLRGKANHASRQPPTHPPTYSLDLLLLSLLVHSTQTTSSIEDRQIKTCTIIIQHSYLKKDLYDRKYQFPPPINNIQCRNSSILICENPITPTQLKPASSQVLTVPLRKHHFMDKLITSRHARPGLKISFSPSFSSSSHSSPWNSSTAQQIEPFHFSQFKCVLVNTTKG